MHYSIVSCPIQFHDLIEIFDFLSNLSPKYLFMYDGLAVALNGYPVMRLRVFYLDGRYCITYRDLHCNFREPLRSNG